MIKLKLIEEKNYKTVKLQTLKEAKVNNKWLVYDKKIEENQLGVVYYNNNQFSDYQEFIPASYNKNYLMNEIIG